jgi:cysteinyl-tRNA synthetase
MAARAGDSAAVLRICDELRDVALPPLGVLLEDESVRGSGDSDCATWTGKWKLRDPAELQKELDDKRKASEDKALAKAAAAAEAAARLADKEAKARLDPKIMFLTDVGKYSAFDADGIPTHDASGVELPKPARKKLVKDHGQQAKLHQWWLTRQSATPSQSGTEAEVDVQPSED